MNPGASIDSIKGVGDVTAEQFRKAGIRTVYDLILTLPRDYEDFSNVGRIADIQPGSVTIKARCESVSTRPVRRGMRITTATLSDGTGKINAVWFNQPYREKQLKTGEEFVFTGVFEFSYNRYQLTNPSAEKAAELPKEQHQLMPIYRMVQGLKVPLLRKLLTELKPLMAMLPETLPGFIVQKEKLMARGDAVLAMHFPGEKDRLEKARERWAFEELFSLMLASQLNRQEMSRLEGYSLQFDQKIVRDFVQHLPFELTNAQRIAAWDILQDFQKPTPMNRLLQGDVGSGKTVVAGLAARQAAHAGYQSAIMAPTEILAIQHAETLNNLLSPFGVRVGLLTGSVKGAARKALYDAIESGEVDVVVGTHALIQETVHFAKLGFVVIDEQHRFGVAQRQALLSKSEKMPHLLAMTATPIPRSLALTVYGELDISILNERPKNRKEIMTKIWSPNSRPQLYALIDQQIKEGRQAYVICNLIDDNPDNERKSVEAEYKRLNVGEFKHRRIGLLHGKLKPAEKEAVMRQFAAGDIDILISTTVVEVGVDVPNATVILIEDADRFGLSQLHQLRGRVGRGAHQSYCYLMVSSSKAPSQRLKEVEKSNDGFYLAEVDLSLRGPGEIYGRAQHGELNLQVANLADAKMIQRAQRSASQFLESGEDLLQYKQLAKDVERYQRLTTLN
ncbi:ATP-dependent DNA helicase RecG [Candidatus Saccharibacteria bacterium]|nr:ATP-dependent DNA helicase RecG [Candidatus Saccharibacteria bacterium]MBQ69300.1 ATP-dependent DNA helicase RecG [Candidatus Saccharibacteria bacterium]|tara:strand:+ start:2077 stop:4107 length:2031 start_codon:yes stop_codon:yes gene_type:complete